VLFTYLDSRYTGGMDVTVDVSPAVNGRAGLGRYAAALAAALAHQHPGSVCLFANLTAEAQDVPELAGLPVKTIRAGYKPWRMAIWLAQLGRVGFNRIVGEADVYHSTEHLLMPLRGVPTVLTVHDLIYRLFPEHHKKLNYWYLNAAMPLYVRRADHIITVSQHTKSDLMRLYGTPDEKITVVYEAAAPHFKPQPDSEVERVRAKYGLPERYLITVGTIEPRKNLARLVQALAWLRQGYPTNRPHDDLRLVVVGSEGWLTESYHQAIDQFDQHEAVIRPGYVPDEDLPAMVAGAVVAVSASLYEGFGLPVLEAMACGTPVACSSTSSVGEISQGAAFWFDPENVSWICAALRELIEKPDLRAILREKGLKKAATFSWDRAAKETWTVYEKVAAKG
jgi:glycosyltransferase involved in cell wall biosynthesis